MKSTQQYTQNVENRVLNSIVKSRTKKNNGRIQSLILFN